MMPQMLGRIDGVVVGDGNEIHSAPFQSFIDGVGRVVALAAKTVESGYVAHAGVPRMDVEIAPHAYL